MLSYEHETHALLPDLNLLSVASFKYTT